jgi:hypothetical protein
MAQSPLLGADRAPQRPRGTGTDVLGPSDTSDTGSDLVGAVGAVDTDALGLDGGTNDDVSRAAGAGADVGDTTLDADSDSGGTGERAEAGRDTVGDRAADIAPDQVITLGEDDVVDELDLLTAEEGDTGDEDEDDELGLDDGATARPPEGRAMPRHQRNTDRPVANGEDSAGDGRRDDRRGSR